MKTTLDIPDAIFRQAKAKAAMDGRKLKELVTEGLELVLSKPSHAVRPLTAMDVMGEACGCVASGVSDLATHPRHMKGMGRE